ncbi:Flp family type IVb pilin [Pseudarthrobacter niigatensis]|uniref:Pilus assembly protein Flp/PilA n=1 Tax=Pseudarthrobacter niigatensis TaxID=369935 RepID=A0AAJ1T277_9MICC|nr:Flp family type IVb pilin [Pseudarthrobacter niigatensis]MDQ0147992.1 pilus assembly protein Flp/PilA [Pseudarthrobacter niigatensis]MDQ0264171.1 pilus assembly protein Flp/PilA [Pseudarthrobacter niigatensis]
MSNVNASYQELLVALRAVLSQEKGATATEYSLLVGLIALVIVAGVTLFGGNLNTFFNSLAGTVGGW